MDSLDSDIIIVLQYLLPGFITAAIFYSFTSYVKPSQFERVVQALIFTIIVQVFTTIIISILIFFGYLINFSLWSNNSSELILSVVLAILLGIVISYYSNNDKLHKFFRKLTVTRETSYASEWFGAFLDNVTYVVLHLNDGRRVYGWPREWPTDPNNGHFVLEEVSWLDKDEEIELDGVKQILIDTTMVTLVEFMGKTWEN